MADKREYAQYNFPEVIGKDYRTVLRHLRKLESFGLIRLARTEPVKKGGKDCKIYTLTLHGLVALLKMMPDLDEADLDVLAANYPDLLPLIFGKWQLFQTHNLKGLIITRLLEAIKIYPWFNPLLMIPEGEVMTESELIRFLIDIYHNKKIAMKRLKKLKEAGRQIYTACENLLQYKITRAVLLDLPFDNQEQFCKLLKVAHGDRDLHNFMDTAFLNLEKEYATYLANIKSWKEWWHSLNNKQSER
ncbi:MAG: hypothetical protein QW707_09790 [Candidatus Bathyarchaeia archaeon]